jgi:hypothetical protein
LASGERRAGINSTQIAITTNNIDMLTFSLIARVSCTDIVVVAVNRGIFTKSSRKITRIISTRIVISTDNRIILALTVNTCSNGAVIAIIAYDLSVNTASIYYTIIRGTGFIIIADDRIIYTTISEDTLNFPA